MKSSSASISLKELIEFLARALVDHPDEVHVTEIAGEQTVVLELKVAKEELARVLALDPEKCEAFGHLAEAERKLRALDAARAAYDRVLECDPGNAALRFNRAYVALLQDRADEVFVDRSVTQYAVDVVQCTRYPDRFGRLPPRSQ